MMDAKSLAGKPLKELTEQELATLESDLTEAAKEVSERRRAVEEAAKAKGLAEIGKAAAKVVTEKLGWQKLPNLTLTPTEDCKSYNVTYGKGSKVKGAKAKNDDNGRVTLAKLEGVYGTIAKYRLKDGREFQSQRDLIKGLGEDDAFSRGYTASGIVVNKHPGEVTLVLESGQEMTVAEAVKKFNEAREKAAQA